MTILISLITGFIFGLGLLISGMVNPAKVLGFLDLAGKWDPSLAFVMGGALAVGLVTFSAARKRSVSLTGCEMELPTTAQLDRRLVIGSLLFGIGWGIAGFCPGPAIVSIVMGNPKTILFTGAMLAGMGIFEILEWRAARLMPGRRRDA